MTKASTLILLPLLSFFWLVCGVLVAGSYYPDYSHLSQFMSALGATGTAHGATVNLVVFAGAELWVLLFVGLAVSAVGKDSLAISGLSLIGLYAVLLLAAAYYPCDFECRPEEPSSAHLIHVSAGFLAYVCGLVGLFVVSCALKRRGSSLLPRGTATGLLLIGALLLAGTVQIEEFAGLLQRLLEVLIYLWLTLTGMALVRALRQSQQST
ncbi:DUF998 domain-containing protein [uncultured Roseibium sp.]|uniref:DUF998 domain-containing protein n=1 Tax=uncultured Roseibium sp. TaxID=1936171 RepID=UPI002638AA8A|nr:DUF998 domain-containing protein [uncultured Roseibium sp.]